MRERTDPCRRSLGNPTQDVDAAGAEQLDALVPVLHREEADPIDRGLSAPVVGEGLHVEGRPFLP